MGQPTSFSLSLLVQKTGIIGGVRKISPSFFKEKDIIVHHFFSTDVFLPKNTLKRDLNIFSTELNSYRQWQQNIL